LGHPSRRAFWRSQLQGQFLSVGWLLYNVYFPLTTGCGTPSLRESRDRSENCQHGVWRAERACVPGESRRAQVPPQPPPSTSRAARGRTRRQPPAHASARTPRVACGRCSSHLSPCTGTACGSHKGLVAVSQVCEACQRREHGLEGRARAPGATPHQRTPPFPHSVATSPQDHVPYTQPPPLCLQDGAVEAAPSDAMETDLTTEACFSPQSRPPLPSCPHSVAHSP